jgi:hypothetical protein
VSEATSARYCMAARWPMRSSSAPPKSAARRGELRMGLPVGLAYDAAGHVVLDPDAGVQQALRHLFAVFARTGSARAVVAAFAAEKLLFPVRISTGPRKGELAWMPLTHWRVLRTLHNPRYAGAFVYGRRRGITSANGKNSLQPLPATSGPR